MFKGKIKSWWQSLTAHKRKIHLALSLLVIAMVLNFLAGSYTNELNASMSSDLILDHFGPINLNFIFVYGWMLTIFLLVIYPFFFRVDKFHSLIYYMSLVIIVRSIFIVFTHLKTPLSAIPVSFPWPIKFISFQNDLFFSGHTAIPMVGFYVFRSSKIRYLFLALSFLFGFTVLATHQHYSIDVFAAYFIVYGTYNLGRVLARKLRVENL